MGKKEAIKNGNREHLHGRRYESRLLDFLSQLVYLTLFDSPKELVMEICTDCDHACGYGEYVT